MKTPRFAIAVAIAAAALVSATTASAYDRTSPYSGGQSEHYAYRGAPTHGVLPRVDQRQARQRQRIEHGVRSGRITPHEARRLIHQQREIRHMERRAIADGVVTTREQQRLEQAQNRASQSIQRRSYDRQPRY